MLGALGAECAGAVVVLPEGDEPGASENEDIRLLSPRDLEALVNDLPRHPLGVDPEPDGVRLSLGGIQDKLVLVRLPTGQFGQPLGGAPSTCLLKPDYGHYEDLAVNEAFCMRVAAATGLDVAATEVIDVGSIPCLYIERFDRVSGDGDRVVRLHQEDMCQALGILPAAKYEANGGPSVAQVVDLLRGLGSPRVALDVNSFVKAVLVNFLLGNSDAHGKNFALLYDPAAGVRLAPLYDVVSTAVYEEVTNRMAMTIGGVEDPAEVDLSAWESLGVDSGLGGQLTRFVRRWSADVLAAAEECLRTAEAEGWRRPVIDSIVDVCRERAGRLIRGR
jgi:serine/threonine-protein kinase HipA